MDGTNSIEDIRRRFAAATHHSVAQKTIEKLVDHLEQARFLEGEGFEAFYASLQDAYRQRGVREMPHAAALGITDHTGSVFEAHLTASRVTVPSGRIRGLIAPHLDYPRGGPCYGDAYGSLRNRPVPDRVVILGTNHFGRAASVVTTGNAFETPLGRTEVDRAFLEAIEAHCGDLRRFELDHAREHSVELQVGFLQHLFGADRFTIVPVLCPDPCGPTGTAPFDGQGPDLDHFAATLEDVMRDAGGDTLVVAGADMSHVGADFGDEGPPDEALLSVVRDRDTRALGYIVANDPDSFLRLIAEDGNSTRICSAGCLYLIRKALPQSQAHVLHYHQAMEAGGPCCVTCAAVAFV